MTAFSGHYLHEQFHEQFLSIRLSQSTNDTMTITWYSAFMALFLSRLNCLTSLHSWFCINRFVLFFWTLSRLSAKTTVNYTKSFNLTIIFKIPGNVQAHCQSHSKSLHSSEQESLELCTVDPQQTSAITDVGCNIFMSWLSKSSTILVCHHSTSSPHSISSNLFCHWLSPEVVTSWLNNSCCSFSEPYLSIYS